MSLMLIAKYVLLLAVAFLMLFFNVKLSIRFMKIKIVTSKVFLKEKEFLNVILIFTTALSFLFIATSSFCITMFLYTETIKFLGMVFANLGALTLLYAFYRFYWMVR